jgi:hypothetical protein
MKKNYLEIAENRKHLLQYHTSQHRANITVKVISKINRA